jgi:hypothetical protein
MNQNYSPNTLTAQERAIKKAKVKELTDTVHRLLIADPRYRDSDALLMNRVQRDEIIALGLDANRMSFNDFLRIRLGKKISSEDSITRLRREVQEYYPETRGDKYKKRQSKQMDVRDDLHDIENEIKSNSNSNSAPMITEPCDYCQGSGKINGFECNMCGGAGEVAR